jgi:ribosomal protein L7/L12
METVWLLGALLIGFLLGLAVGRSGSERGYRQPPADAPDPSGVHGVDELIRQGQKIQAIMRYRDETGTGLRVAKDAIDAREAELRRQQL